MSGFVSGLVGVAQELFGTRPVAGDQWRTASQRDDPAGLHAMLRALASNTNAYRELSALLHGYGLGGTAMQGLRNPTHAVAAVYRATLWPGTIREDDNESALPLVLPERPTNDALRQAIHSVWRASNWDRRKQTAAYDCALLGEQVLRVVASKTQRPHFELLQPEYLTDLDVDGRGFLTYARVDIPQVRREADGRVVTVWHTEVWDKPAGTFRRWEHTQGARAALGRLGAPAEALDLEQVHGSDFVPFVHWKHAESSDNPRGVSALLHALDKIVWGDALVTALHQRLTNHNLPDKVMESRQIDSGLGTSVAPPIDADVREITLAGETMWVVPSGWTLRDTVAQLDYANHLAVVNAHYAALAETDLPELAWYRVSEAGGELSGKALDYKLTPAKANIDAARGNAEDALIRITQMTLTVAQSLGLRAFSAEAIGVYERGDLDFWIADRPIVPLSQQEQSELDTAAVARVTQRTQAGMSLLRALLAEDATLSEEDARLLAQADVVDGVRQ